MSGRDQYPQRANFSANKLIRLMQKSCAANIIGIEACWLVTCIALVEDSKRYSGPVTFWSAQLLPIAGFQSWGRLDRARTRAVEAGWLYYRAGTNRQCGVYWCLIPDAIQRAFNDSPVDEVNHHFGDHAEVNHQNGDSGEDRTVIETQSKRSAHGEPSIPIPCPIPEESDSLSSTSSPAKKSKKSAGEYPHQFEAIWKAYPKRVNKRKTHEAYQAALKRVISSQNIDQAAAVAWLLHRVTAFAVSHKGRKYPSDSFRWFQDDRFDDSNEAWQDYNLCTGSVAGEPSDDTGELVHKICRKVWSPDAKNRDEVKAAIGDDIAFAAAAKIGFSKMADDWKHDRVVRDAFYRHLESERAKQ